jgi:hypothetical protein
MGVATSVAAVNSTTSQRADIAPSQVGCTKSWWRVLARNRSNATRRRLQFGWYVTGYATKVQAL